MKYNVVSYLIGEGFRNIFKNKKSTISALTIMCLCMLVFGIFFIIGENINNVMKTVEEAQGLKVYFNVGTDDETMKKAGEAFKKIEGINKVEFVSKEDGFNEMKESYGSKALEGMESEFMPDSYKITLSNLELNEQVQNQIKEIVGENLDEIRSSNEIIEMIMGIGKGVRLFTLALLIILVFISIVIISNTIKLTVHARRKEISIMKYVGATNSFIRSPFIVEGIIIGIIAALIAVVIIGMIYNAIIPNMIESEVVKELEISFVTFSKMFNLLMVVYLVLGIGIGTIGSSISMRKYLEV